MTDFQAGALVQVRGEPWRVAHVDPVDGGAVLTLEGRGADNAGCRLRVIEPFDRPSFPRAKAWRRRTRGVVLRAALATIAEARPASGLWSAAAAAIDLHAYQLEPALAILRGATRLLLADAVGLGKTIQAGLILAELRARGWIERALVVCPAGLRAGWAAELRARFGIECAVFDQDAVAEAVASLPTGINPWSTHGVTIASIDFVKRPEVLAAIGGVALDLLIADEAHHLTPGSDRGAAIDRLAARTPWCIFVSATPHSGDQAAFDYLTGLGAHGDAITIFRRGREDARMTGSRRRRVLAVRPAHDDAVLIDAVEDYARSIWRQRGQQDRIARLIAITMARRAASSPLAIARTLARRLALLGTAAEPMQAWLPWDEVDEADGAGADSLLAAPALGSDAAERAVIEDLITLARRCGPGAKIRRLLRLLDRVREAAIVFTEYRDTAEAVMAALPAGCRSACIHGAMSAAERQHAVDTFTRGAAGVLVATDAAGEGLNLQHCCRLVIDMELPWNPLRLEQRVGRVDRLGQRRRVHALSLFHPGGIEERVLRHLRIRQRRAESATESVATELDVARAVFEGIAPDTRPLPELRTSPLACGAAEAGRLAHVRRIRRLGWQALDHPAWSRPRRRRRAVFAVLRRSTGSNAQGVLLGEHMDCWLAEVAPPQGWREWPAIAKALSERQPPLVAEAAGDRAAIVRRIDSIRSRALRDRARERQRSLFDRRADADARLDQRAASGAIAALVRRRASLDPSVAADGLRTALVAIWPLGSR